MTSLRFDVASALRWSALGLLAIGLAACGHVPLTSLYELSRFDPLTVDPAVIRAAVRLPEELRPRPDGVTMDIAFEAPGRRLAERFVLARVGDGAAEPSLRGEVVRGTAVHVFRLAPSDVDRLMALRREISALKAGSGGKGSMSVGAAACRTSARVPKRLLITTWLKFERAGRFVPVVRDLDLTAAAQGAKTEATPQC
ncbi:MAG: hypothetical protein R3D27_00285 [Hyphomicrobiaceae bacterium]